MANVQIEEFVNELYAFVAGELRQREDMAYCRDRVKVVDARNHLFRCDDKGDTDEAEDKYALKDLCRLDDDMQYVPDRQRMQRIALNYWRE